ncbi:uncharacterized protein LOC133853903 [Alnus glutinosa]|uniref:uncharacterized protein LOC133853903 n=1 Tax=Alnus glutinosa TaxID=3517 RepID=UPI002D771116|nr:uncharacterized protein LOC133853903 [Alnus glutinosa]
MAQRLADAGRLWGKAVIIPSDKEEVRQEPVASSGDFLEEMDEEVGTPRDEPLAEESEVEVSCSAPIQTETPTGMSEAEDVEEPCPSREVIDQEVPGSAPETQSPGQPETTPHVGVAEESRIDSENVTPEAGVLPKTSTRSESRAEASPSTGAVPQVGPSSSSRMTALWQKCKNRPASPPTPSPEVQARISGLEDEVAALKSLLQSKDEELASRDSIISEMRSANARLSNEVAEANGRYARSIESLSSELDRADQLSTRLSAVQNECSEACKNALSAEAEKDKLKDEVERLTAERDKALKAQDHSESLLIRLRARYDADRTVDPTLVGFPEEAINEMEEFGKDFMPDVPNWGLDAPVPEEDPLDDPAS